MQLISHFMITLINLVFFPSYKLTVSEYRILSLQMLSA